MTEPVISVTNLSKRYFLSHQRGPRDGLRASIEDAIRNPIRWLRTYNMRVAESREEFWALRDVSFEVNQGDVVGIIGRNGAGKSTLLKILSRITEPTSGRIITNGRVASLLEVGTGFHPELTGRENVFLNGAILGMTKIEIQRKFDEIVAFSSVERFLDTPVKRYSSGMYVRLAFAVAAHLEPEILIVDEVLAVGDAQFQKKCMGKMQDVSSLGRTILFVSHSMSAVSKLCTRAILLKGGCVASTGTTDTVVSSYVREASYGSAVNLEDYPLRSGSGLIRVTGMLFEDTSGRPISHVQTGSDFVLVLRYRKSTSLSGCSVNVGFYIHKADESLISVLYSSYTGNYFQCPSPRGEFRCLIRRLPLKEGCYPLAVRIECNGEEADFPRGMVGNLEVIGGDFYRSGAKLMYNDAPLLISGDWSQRNN